MDIHCSFGETFALFFFWLKYIFCHYNIYGFHFSPFKKNYFDLVPVIYLFHFGPYSNAYIMTGTKTKKYIIRTKAKQKF